MRLRGCAVARFYGCRGFHDCAVATVARFYGCHGFPISTVARLPRLRGFTGLHADGNALTVVHGEALERGISSQSSGQWETIYRFKPLLGKLYRLIRLIV